jgi:peptide/nickel transport system permease protein
MAATATTQRMRLPRTGGHLTRYVLRRLALAAVTLWLVTVVVFFITNILPGNPALVRLGGLASPEAVEAEEKRMGLDRPMLERYWDFVSGAVVGDFGRSFKTEQPVATDLADRLPATLELALLATFLALAIGVPLGFLAAVRRGSAVDHAARTVASLAAAMPIFWLGLVLVFVFAYQLGWAPGTVGRFPLDQEAPPLVTGFFTIDSLLAGDIAGFFTALHYLALPVLTLAIIELAPIIKMARSSMVETLETDYVRTSRGLGFSPRQIFFGDALRNALIPILTLLGIVLGYLVAGNVIVETLFSWPGIGRYAFGALTANDFNAIQGFILLVAVIYVLLNLAIDLLYAVIDPRIRLG